MNNARKKRPGTQPCSIIPIDVGARTPRSHNGLTWARIRYALESGGFYLQHQNERTKLMILQGGAKHRRADLHEIAQLRSGRMLYLIPHSSTPRKIPVG